MLNLNIRLERLSNFNHMFNHSEYLRCLAIWPLPNDTDYAKRCIFQKVEKAMKAPLNQSRQLHTGSYGRIISIDLLIISLGYMDFTEVSTDQASIQLTRSFWIGQSSQPKCIWFFLKKHKVYRLHLVSSIPSMNTDLHRAQFVQ